MKRLTLLGCVVGIASTAQAQARSSSDDLAAWYGIMVSPAGAFPSIETASSATTQLAFRASTWKAPGTDVNQNNFGISYLSAPAASNIRYGLTVGWLQPSGASASDGTIMFGGDAGGPFWQNAASTNAGTTFGLDWKLSVGGGHSRAEGGIEYWSVVGQVPFKWTYRMASKSALSAFASAGYGVAGVGDAADAENGMRPMLSFGGAWTSARGLGLHLGAQQVMLDDTGSGGPPWVMGFSLSLPLGR